MFSGVHELVFYDGKIYCVVQIQRMLKYNDTSNAEQVSRSASKTAGAILYAFDVATSTLTDMEKYQFITNSGRSITINDDRVFYAESTDATYKYRAYNPDDVDTFTLGINQNIFPELRGALKSIDPSKDFSDVNSDGERTAIKNHGNIFFERLPYRGIGMPMLSVDNELHMVASYGNPDTLPRTDSEGSLPNNYQWLKFGRKLVYVLQSLQTTTSYNLLVDIANKTNSIFYMRNGRIVFKERDAIKAKLNANITPTSASLSIKDETRDLPDSGYMLVDREIVKYNTGFSIERGQAGTIAVAHGENAEVIYLDNVVNKDSYLTVNIAVDTNRFYNVVQDSNLTNRQQDLESIERYGEKVFNINLGLGGHQHAWREYMYRKYLEYLKEIRQLVSVSLKKSNYLTIGDVISFNYAGVFVYPIRIISINHQRESIQVVGRSI